VNPVLAALNLYGNYRLQSTGLYFPWTFWRIVPMALEAVISGTCFYAWFQWLTGKPRAWNPEAEQQNGPDDAPNS
jgi:hypothetical protein